MLTRSDNAKLLGLFIDSKLNWKCYVHELSLKLARDVVMLSFASKYVPKDYFLTLYHAFLKSHLCNTIELSSAAGLTEIN